jgi:Ca2+-binding RTX toxin-like protein
MAISPSPQDDIILGTVGPDTIKAQEGNDTVYGLTGDDDLDGQEGNDTVNGDEGDDTLRVSGVGTDTANGGIDDDLLIVNYSDASSAVTTSNFPTRNLAEGGFNGSYNIVGNRSVTYTSIERFDITTGSGNDNIRVAGMRSVVSTGLGDDIVNLGDSDAAADRNRADGGADVDGISANFFGSSAPVTWNLQTGTFNGDAAKFVNFEYFEVLELGNGNDVIVTTGVRKSDFISLFGGDDRATVVNGNDTVNGGAGFDTLVIDYSGSTAGVFNGSEPSPDQHSGGGFLGFFLTQNDRSVGYNGIERFEITTGIGNDRITTATGDDIVRTGAGNDMVNGAAGNDYIDPGTGDDMVNGGDGNDFLFFGGDLTNGDSVDGGAGTDTLALLGNYTLTFDANDLVGIERLFVFNGNRFDPAGGLASYSLTTIDANVGAEGLFVTAASLRSNETLFFNGSAETDGAFKIQGGAGADTLIGGAQNDYLTGNAGDDILLGKGGDDYLVGGAGADQLRGGFGSDIFRFLSASDSTPDAPDRIADFQLGEKIDLSAIDADTVAEGDQAFTFINADSFSATGEAQVRATYDANTKLWSVEGDIDGNGTTDFLILVSRPNSELPITANELVL